MMGGVLYGAAAPLATHWRRATCAEVDCVAWSGGWITTIDESTDLGRRQGQIVRANRKGQYREARNEAGLTTFTFPAGAQCFNASTHRVKVERPMLYYRRSAGSRARAMGGAEWGERFAVEQNAVADRLNNLRAG